MKIIINDYFKVREDALIISISEFHSILKDFGVIFSVVDEFIILPQKITLDDISGMKFLKTGIFVYETFDAFSTYDEPLQLILRNPNEN